MRCTPIFFSIGAIATYMVLVSKHLCAELSSNFKFASQVFSQVIRIGHRALGALGLRSHVPQLPHQHPPRSPPRYGGVSSFEAGVPRPSLSRGRTLKPSEAVREG